jgi:hypothetical protein
MVKEDMKGTDSVISVEVHEGAIIDAEAMVGKPIITALRDVSMAVHQELAKPAKDQDKDLLENYSKLYTSLAAVMGLYRTSKFSFSLTGHEFLITVVWFIGAIITAGFVRRRSIHSLPDHDDS